MPLELTLVVLSAAIAEACRRVNFKLVFHKKKRLFKDIEKFRKTIYMKTNLQIHHNFVGIMFVIYSFISNNFEPFCLGSGLLLHHFFTEGW